MNRKAHKMANAFVIAGRRTKEPKQRRTPAGEGGVFYQWEKPCQGGKRGGVG